jgi:hypothetical protein
VHCQHKANRWCPYASIKGIMQWMPGVRTARNLPHLSRTTCCFSRTTINAAHKIGSTADTQWAHDHALVHLLNATIKNMPPRTPRITPVAMDPPESDIFQVNSGHKHGKANRRPKNSCERHCLCWHLRTGVVSQQSLSRCLTIQARVSGIQRRSVSRSAKISMNCRKCR